MSTKQKRVLLIIDQLSSGGAERQIVNLAIGLKSNGYDVRLCRFYNGEIFYNKDLDENGIAVETITNAKSAFKRPFALASLIRRWDPAAVIAYKEGTAMGACLARLLTPFNLIVSERNTTQTLSSKEKLKFFLYRYATYIVPNSYSQAKFIQDNYPKLGKKTRVITNTIDTNRFHKTERGKSEDNIIITTTARVMPQKNVLTYLEAVRILRDKYPQVKFKWYGNQDDTYFNLVRDKILELGLSDTIVFERAIKDVERAYQEADVYCLPSVYEGFPNVVCEAMACGLPIACSNVCDNPRIVKDGVNGYLFNPSSPKDIAETLQKIINLSNIKYSEMSMNNVVAIRNLSSSDVFISKYSELIDK